MESSKMTTEMENLKSKLRTTWTAGDFGRIAETYAPGAAELVERLAIEKGSRVLDAACGTGNLSLPAARAGASVTGIDLVPEHISQAVSNSEIAGLDAEFDIGDVEALPYRDATFDLVMTMFGAMFAPRPDVTASELKRVTKPGGRIAMANWTPEGFIGQMFKATGKHVKPAAGMPSPLLWGVEDEVATRFAEGIVDLKTERRTIWFNLPVSPVETVEFFRLYYGPTQKAFASLDDAGQKALRADLESLWADHNEATDGSTRVSSEYLEVRAIRSK
ncbi:MAG TPA: class I SAM-dependent methyltransferase [Pyrinomonadaceae bacterium]